MLKYTDESGELIACVKKYGGGNVQLNWCSITLCGLTTLINYYIEKEYKPAFMADGSSVCPLCGVDSPHQHTPLEQVIYNNGIKHGLRHR